VPLRLQKRVLDEVRGTELGLCSGPITSFEIIKEVLAGTARASGQGSVAQVQGMESGLCNHDIRLVARRLLATLFMRSSTARDSQAWVHRIESFHEYAARGTEKARMFHEPYHSVKTYGLKGRRTTIYLRKET